MNRERVLEILRSLSRPDVDLMGFWSRHQRGRIVAADLLGGRFPGFTGVAADLANYACNRHVMLTCAARGDARAARAYAMAAKLAAQSALLGVA